MGIGEYDRLAQNKKVPALVYRGWRRGQQGSTTGECESSSPPSPPVVLHDGFLCDALDGRGLERVEVGRDRRVVRAAGGLRARFRERPDFRGGRRACGDVREGNGVSSLLCAFALASSAT